MRPPQYTVGACFRPLSIWDEQGSGIFVQLMMWSPKLLRTTTEDCYVVEVLPMQISMTHRSICLTIHSVTIQSYMACLLNCLLAGWLAGGLLGFLTFVAFCFKIGFAAS